MQEIHISYSELKNIAQRFIRHVSEQTGCDLTEVSISTGINDDLGVDGNDWDPILQALVHQEGLNLKGFNYYDYFSDEGAIGGGRAAAVIFFPFAVISYLAANPRRDWSVKGFQQHMFPLGSGKTLSVADLITTKIEGRFVPRSERRYIFK